MFERFEYEIVDVGATTIAARWGGAGDPVLLPHGFPETHAMWHRVAPALVADFAVVCADLRGYGASGTPASAPDQAPYAKAAMAADMVAPMQHLGFERFSVVGHDRGGRVAYRLALDYGERVRRLAVLDVIPTGEALDRADARLALGYWPWSLLAQPEPLPERLIAAAPDAVVSAAIDEWGSKPRSVPRPCSQPVHRRAERSGNDARDLRGIPSGCNPRPRVGPMRSCRRATSAAPTLVLWAASGPLDSWYQDADGPLGVWRAWAPDVTGRSLPGGHFFPEENPEGTLAALRAFLQP